MKKVVSLVLALAIFATLVIVPVSAAEQNVFMAYDAYELKNGSTPWSYQRAIIGRDEYEDLEFIDSGWYMEFFHNWAAGSWPYGFKSNGLNISGNPGSIGDAVITFTAPRDGNIQIPSFPVHGSGNDGVKVQMLKGDLVIFPEDDDWYNPDEVEWDVTVPHIYMTVEKGDKIFFRINMRENQHNDSCRLTDYQVKYLSAEAYKKGVTREGVIVVDAEPLKEKEKIQVNFTDIKGHWGETYIVPLAEEGIIKGKSATTFEPDSNITRAEFLTLALNVAGISATAGESYADVDAGAWFAATIATSKSLGLIDENMTLDGNFKPDQNITREEMTSVIVKLYESQKTEAQAGDVTVFSDNANFSDWATDSIGKAVALGVVTGNPDGTFNALGNATRAEAAVIFSRLLNLL